MNNNIKKIIEEEGHIKKFEGCAPEGFILIHEKALEQLRNFETWKDWKNNITTIEELNKVNFNNT